MTLVVDLFCRRDAATKSASDHGRRVTPARRERSPRCRLLRQHPPGYGRLGHDPRCGAGWLHGGLLHILFNVLWIRQLAPAVAELYGAGRMVILYVVSGAVGFLFSSFGPVFLFPLAPILGSGNLAFGGTYTVGASAPIFGLLGPMVH